MRDGTAGNSFRTEPDRQEEGVMSTHVSCAAEAGAKAHAELRPER